MRQLHATKSLVTEFLEHRLHSKGDDILNVAIKYNIRSMITEGGFVMNLYKGQNEEVKKMTQELIFIHNSPKL